jgi:outer membrane PBP1 activator LpoA protein
MTRTNSTSCRNRPPGTGPGGVSDPAHRAWQRMLVPLALVALALVVGACSSTGSGGRSVQVARTNAQAQAEVGNHQEAARLLEAALPGTAGDVRDALLLEAAGQWWLAGNRPRASALVDQRATPPPEEGDAVVQLLGAAQLLQAGQGAAALDRLNRIASPYPTALNADVYEYIGLARIQAGDVAGGTRALVQREIWLTDEAAVAANGQLIWQQLQSARGVPASLQARTGDAVTDGWLALALLARQGAGGPGQMRSDLRAWLTRHPTHPGAELVLPGLLARYRALTEYPQRIAMLLPLSGSLASSAAAIRDGFISAQLAAGVDDVDIQLDIIDTQVVGPAEAYADAVAGGADFIVGPLRKDAVLEIADFPGKRVPTLALNDPGDDFAGVPPGADFYRFALAPEEEAEQAARRAIEEGHHKLLALVPSNSWGDRLLSGFRAGVEAEESAILVEHDLYASSQADFSSVIRRAFRLDQSDDRYSALRAVVGTPLEFVPRQRGDVDALLVAAPINAARLLRPQLRFHLPTDLPVYMTAAALDPRPDANRDVEGVVFADIPWLAASAHADDPRWQALEKYASDGARRARLFAMGADAFGLIPAIWAGVESDTGILLRGLTGTLRAAPDGRITRELQFLQLRKGEIVVVPDPASPAPETDYQLSSVN